MSRSAIAADAEMIRELCRGLLGEYLGPPVEEYFPHIRTRYESNGRPAIEVGSKPYIFWRQRTPPWVPPGAFALHYQTAADVRSSVARQHSYIAKANGERIPPAISEAEMSTLATNPELKRLLCENGVFCGGQAAGFICVQNGAAPPELVFFPKALKKQHQLFLDHYRTEHPAARLLYVGAAVFTFGSGDRAEYLHSILLDDEGRFVEDQELKGLDGLRAFLPHLRRIMNLRDDVPVQFMDPFSGWGKIAREELGLPRELPLSALQSGIVLPAQ